MSELTMQYRIGACWRAKRSNLQTNTQSISRFLAADIKALSWGRPSRRPDTPTSQ